MDGKFSWTNEVSVKNGNGDAKDHCLIGAIDAGTSSTRFAIFDSNTKLVCSAQTPFDIIAPKPGWAEQKATDLTYSALACIENAWKRALELGACIENMKGCGVGITNQRETTVAYSKSTGESFHPAIVWLDVRTESTVEQMVNKPDNEVDGIVGSGEQDRLRALCGLPLNPYFSAVKMRWLLDNVDGLAQQPDLALSTVDAFLMHFLSNGQVFATDVTNASRTMLMNLKERTWDARLLQFFGIPDACLPAIRSSSETYGAIAVGSLAGVPLCGCLGDQHAALLGQGALQRGQAKNTYGTGCFLLANVGTEPTHSTHGLLSTMAFQLGPDQPAFYALEGSVAIAGAGVKFLQQNLGLVESPTELSQLAASVPDAAGVTFIPALTGLLCPHWKSDARGIILGLSQHSTKAHICRAFIESICFQTKELLQAIESDTGHPLSHLMVDGGMTASNILLEVQANFAQVPVERAGFPETTVLGAALAAGLASKVYALDRVPSLLADNHGSTGESTFKPQMDAQAVTSAFQIWQSKIPITYQN